MPQTVVESIMTEFKQFATAVFEKYGEPRNLCLVVDWEIGKNDFPAGVMVPRNKNVEPDVMLDVHDQLSKFDRRIMAIYGDAARDTHRQLVEAREEIVKLGKAATADKDSGRTAGDGGPAV